MERPWYTRFNWLLAGSCIALNLIGVLFISSATLHEPYAAGEWKSQAVFAVVGILVMFGVAFIDYHRWETWAIPIYLVTLGLLVFIALKGHSALGAARWIQLGGVYVSAVGAGQADHRDLDRGAARARANYRSLWQLVDPHWRSWRFRRC